MRPAANVSWARMGPGRILVKLAAAMLHPVKYVYGRLWVYRAHRRAGMHRLAAAGKDTHLWPPTIIAGAERIRLGERVIVYPGAFISVVGTWRGRDYEAELVVGDRVTIGHDLVVSCAARVEVGHDTAIGHRVYIGDTSHDYRCIGVNPMDAELIEPRPISIGSFCYLGTGCAIMPGVTIGDGAVVGVNSVVTQDVPSHTVVVGNPARAVRRFDGNGWVTVRSESETATAP